MKSIYKFGILFIALFAFSCSEKLEELNIDPDSSPTARPQEVLTSAQGYISWVVESQFSERSALWGQYWAWGPGVAIGDAGRYIMNGASANNLWSRAYANALTDLQYLVRSEDPAFVGMGKILQAYTFQMLVDFFGDIPFSEALKGEIDDGSVLAPSYDDDASIYAALIPLVDEGIEQLNAASAGDVGSEDLIYGGDLDSWTRFANSLKLRILMRQSAVSDMGGAVTSLINSATFVESTAEAPFIEFLGDAGNENPMFADFESGVANFYVASNSSLNVLRELSDPRIDKIYDPAPNSGTVEGLDQGAAADLPNTIPVEDFSQGSKITYAVDNPVILMSDWEVWFLRAEAAARYGTSDDESEALSNAITSHFNYVGLDDAAASSYISTLGYDAGSGLNDKISIIGVQKWISMNGLQEPEGWTEARRFDTPDNPIFTDPASGIFQTPTASSLGQGVHPSSWVYPATEISLNSNSPSQKSIMDKVFWDN
ncbi:SusD/RagB family nutrient-binding outer membrane lipoprotein [Membranihabitans maritimus]|uniref:SusD/RagB family nutrient-binding outer membrane lipoprotein n=1 Tax=Membranihabitans maritimus TaxID=2904244 RepID=UPI001F3CF0FC|nr:SusD/RagB family nutrient-binding outer membrane lipoprotein [Membranihabitans maritimus]